jgi:hypothetical protein
MFSTVTATKSDISSSNKQTRYIVFILLLLDTNTVHYPMVFIQFYCWSVNLQCVKLAFTAGELLQ